MADAHITTKDNPNAFAANIAAIRVITKTYFPNYAAVYGSVYGTNPLVVDTMTDAQVIKIYDNEDYFFEITSGL